MHIFYDAIYQMSFMQTRSRSKCYGSLDQTLLVDPLSYFLLQTVLETGLTKVVVCENLHITNPLLLIGKVSP